MGSVQFLSIFTELSVIDLSYNLLSGQLPDCFANFKRLWILKLNNNNFHGKIPPFLGVLNSLEVLNLQKNNFSGEIPPSMCDGKSLTVLELGENKLTGEVPSWIEECENLVALVLRSNGFHGEMPPNLCNLPALRVLDLSSNMISGEIPNCLGNLSSMTEDNNFAGVYVRGPVDEIFYVSYPLESADMIWKREIVFMQSDDLPTFIDISSNDLVGQIPSEITLLVGLLGLNFSRNKLTGPIPQHIDNLTLLNVLDLSNNHLSGSVPISLAELSHLGILDLSYNNLSGRIPPNDHLLTFDESAYVGNPSLCGRPVNKSCPGDQVSAIKDPEHENHHNEDEDEFISEGFYICLGLGFAFGLWGILGLIMLNKPFRYSFLKVVNNIEDFLYVRVELTKIHFRKQFENGPVLPSN